MQHSSEELQTWDPHRTGGGGGGGPLLEPLNPLLVIPLVDAALVPTPLDTPLVAGAVFPLVLPEYPLLLAVSPLVVP
jgi:hypothetical protein